jgi:hypothetical protein
MPGQTCADLIGVMLLHQKAGLLPAGTGGDSVETTRGVA